MKPCKKQWLQTGIALVCSLAIVLSVFPTFADDSIDELEGQTTALEEELAGINQEILDLTEQLTTTEMQIEILNGEIERTSDALAEAEANEAKQYEDMKTRIKYMYEAGSGTATMEKVMSSGNISDHVVQKFWSLMVQKLQSPITQFQAVLFHDGQSLPARGRVGIGGTRGNHIKRVP